MTETEHLKKKIRYAEAVIASSHARLAAITRAEEKLLEEKRAKGRTLRLARKHGLEIEDDMKEFDRIGVWPKWLNEGIESDPHDGDHYIYSWTEAEKRVLDYIKGAA